MGLERSRVVAPGERPSGSWRRPAAHPTGASSRSCRWRSRAFRSVSFGSSAGMSATSLVPSASPPIVARGGGGASGRAWHVNAHRVHRAEDLAGDADWPVLLGGRSLRREESPTLRFSGSDGDELLRSKSSNFREQVRRRERSRSASGEASFRLAGDPERLDQDIDSLFALHRARWAGERTTFGGSASFHRAFARRALERGWLRLWFLEVDGKPRAATYGFRFGDVESYYQGGRNPAGTVSWASSSSCTQFGRRSRAGCRSTGSYAVAKLQVPGLPMRTTASRRLR